MVYEYDYGHLLRMDATAAEDLPYYRFIEISDAGFFLATGKWPVVGVTVPNVQDEVLKSDGTRHQRTGYLMGERPQILQMGVCFVELKDPVNMGGYVTVGELGKAENLMEAAEENITKKKKDTEMVEKPIRGMVLDDRDHEGLVRILLKVL